MLSSPANLVARILGKSTIAEYSDRHESNFKEGITPSRSDAASRAHRPILTLIFSIAVYWLLAYLFYGGWKPFIVIAEKNESEIEWPPEELVEGLMAVAPIPPSYDASVHRGHVYHE